MKRIKKITALILSILMLTSLTSFAVYEDVSGEQLNEAIDFFEALNLISGYEDGNFRPEQGMVRADFAIMAAGLLGYEESQTYQIQHFTDVPETSAAYGSVEFLYSKGLINGNGQKLFDPDSPILNAHAIKIIMSALGYDYYAELNEGYPSGYFKAAEYAGLPSYGGVTSVLSRGQACQFLYKSMNAPMMGYSGIGGYVKDKSKTLLNETLKMTKNEGMFVADSSMSIFGEYNVSDGYVVLDYKRYKTLTSNISDLVGHYVYYYLNDDNEVVAVIDKSKSSITVDGDDINENTGTETLKYRVGEKNKSHNIASDAYFVYNGMPCPNITDDYFKDIYGSVTLINNDDDKYADTVIIWNYKNYIVKSYSPYTSKLYTKNPEYEFDLSDIEYVIKKDGTAIAPETLSSGQVITVAENNLKANFYISDKFMTGMIESEDTTNGEFTVNGTVYKKAKDFNDSFEYGITYDIYFDMLGNIYHLEKTSSETTAYVYNSFQGSPADEDEVYSKVFTEKGKKETLKYASKVSVIYGNEKSVYKPGKLLASLLRNTNGESVAMIVKYELNGNNEISKIKVPVDAQWDDFSEDYFKCNMDTQKAYSNYYNQTGKEPSLSNEKATMYNTLLSWINGTSVKRNEDNQVLPNRNDEDKQYSAAMDADTVIFDITKNEKDWSVKNTGSYSNGTVFPNAKIYDRTKTGAVKYMLVVSDRVGGDTTSFTYDDPMILVTNKLTTLNDDEEACYAVTGMKYDGTKEHYYTVDPELSSNAPVSMQRIMDFADVDLGDIIQIKTDAYNNISGFRLLCKGNGNPECLYNPFPTDQVSESAKLSLPPISHGNAFYGPCAFEDGICVYKNSQAVIDEYDNGTYQYPICRYMHSASNDVILMFNRKSRISAVLKADEGFSTDEAFVYTYPGYGRKMIVLYQ